MSSSSKRGALGAICVAVMMFFVAVSVVVCSAAESYVVADNVDYVSEANCVNNTSATLQPDGSVQFTQKTENPSGSRVFYGSQNGTYGVDMRNFEMKFSVNQIDPGAYYQIAFLTDIGQYPTGGWGKGLGVRFLDRNVNFGDYSVETFYYPSAKAGPGWRLNLSESTKPSYVNKIFTLKCEDAGDNINVLLSYDDGLNDKLNAGLPIPKAELTASGLDFTNASFMVTPGGNFTKDFKFTIHSITDTKTAEYKASIGAPALTAAASYTSKLTALSSSVNTITVAQIKELYTLKSSITDTTKLRKADKFVINTALAMDSAVVDAKSKTMIADVIGSYTADTVVTEANVQDIKSVIAVCQMLKIDDAATVALVNALNESITLYEKGGEIAGFIAEIDAFLAANAVVDASNYKAVCVAFDALMAKYNGLSEIVKSKITNFSKLQEFKNVQLLAGKNAYYTTAGTDFTNDCGQSNNGAKAVYQNGKTDIELIDMFGNTRLAYGTNMGEGNVYTNYKVNFSNFEIKFTINDIDNSGRFFFCFGADRTMFPVGSGNVQGLAFTIRMSGNTKFDLAFHNAADGQYADIPGLQGWGVVGSLTNNSGVIGKEITYKLVEVGENYVLTASIEGGNSITSNIPKTFFTSRELDATSLAMLIGTGEGSANYNNGKDIKLSINAINDDYSRSLTDLDLKIGEANASAVTTDAIANLTIQNVQTFNAKLAKADLSILRPKDTAVYTAKLDSVKIASINAKAAKIVTDNIALLPETITGDNLASAKTLLSEIQSDYAILSAAQQALVTNYGVVATTQELVKTYESNMAAAQVVITKIAALDYSTITKANYVVALGEYTTVKAEYDALTDAVKLLVSNSAKLVELGNNLATYKTTEVEKVNTAFGSIDGATIITDENVSAISAAILLYDDLLAELKSQTTIHASIATVKANLEEYKKLNEEKVNRIQAELADSKITAIGVVAFTVDCKAKIDTARTFYNSLTEVQQGLVTLLTTLTQAEAEYARLGVIDADTKAAKPVTDMITAMNTTYATITGSNKKAALADIASALAAYNTLSAAQKAYVTNYADIAVLQQKIEVYEQGVKDYATAMVVANAITDADQTYATITQQNIALAKQAVIDLKADYDALTAAVKLLVPNYATIATIEARIAAYEQAEANKTAADAVIAKINLIGTVTFTDASKAKIDTALAAYNALTAEQKELVRNYSVLQLAQTTYANLKQEAEKPKEEPKKGCNSAAAMSAIFAFLGLAVMFVKRRV